MALVYKTEVKVYDDTKHLGTIRENFDAEGRSGWRYFPKGSRTGGELHGTLAQCRVALEGRHGLS